jgi:hypothetical protein
MKKLSLIILLFIFLSGCALKSPDANENKKIKNIPEISDEEREFNASGRAKAILDEFDLLTSFQKIQGRWISIDDRKSVIEFLDNKKIDYYDGEIMYEEIFEIDNDDYLTTQSDDENIKYKIIELTKNNLVLSYLPRGNTLKFERTN